MTNKKEITFLEDLNALIKKHNVVIESDSHCDVAWIEVFGDVNLSFDDRISSEIIENKIYLLGEKK